MVPVLPSWNVPRYNESFNKKRNRKSDSVIVVVNRNDDFPHKYKIQAYLGIIFVLLLFIILSYVYFISSSTDYRPTEFYDPCGVPNILSINEVLKLKDELQKTTNKLEIMKETIANNLQPETKPSILLQLKQLKQNHQKQDQKLKYQIQHRTDCYQRNVQRYLETNDSQQQLIDIIYISFQALFLTMLGYYIYKIRKFKFTSRQKNSYKLYIIFAIILLIIHVVFGIYVIISYINQSYVFDKNRIKDIPDF